MDRYTERCFTGSTVLWRGPLSSWRGRWVDTRGAVLSRQQVSDPRGSSPSLLKWVMLLSLCGFTGLSITLMLSGTLETGGVSISQPLGLFETISYPLTGRMQLLPDTDSKACCYLFQVLKSIQGEATVHLESTHKITHNRLSTPANIRCFALCG